MAKKENFLSTFKRWKSQVITIVFAIISIVHIGNPYTIFSSSKNTGYSLLEIIERKVLGDKGGYKKIEI